MCDCYDWSYCFSKNVSNLRGGVLLYGVGCLLLCDCYDWSYWFSKNVLNFTVVVLFIVGCLLLCDHYDWSYCFLKNVSNLCGGVLLFNVDCLLLCNHYNWLYWFSTLIVVHALCTASRCGFLLRLYRRKFFHFLLYGDIPSLVLNL